MKSIKNITLLMAVGLMLQVGVGFAYSKLSVEQAQNILDRIDRESKSGSNDAWEPTGPTAEDILSATTNVENLAAKGSLEEKLINAVKNGDLKNVQAFIAAGAGLEARDSENMTVLMIAADKVYSDIARVLIDAGADINAKDKFRCTALFKAADKNNVEIVKMLIAKGAVDESFEGMLMRAAFEGNIEMVEALNKEAQ